MSKRIPWFEIILGVAFLSANIYAAFSDAYNLPNRWFIRDDAYYYFKVAQNISEGRGSTFDGIHATNGYHPLWLLICVPIFALARFDLILPLRVLVLVTGVLQLATALLLYRLVRAAISPPAGMLAAAYWAFNTYILLFLYKTGVESSIALFLMVLLLYRMQRSESALRGTDHDYGTLAPLGLLALLVTLSRLDLIFFAVAAGVWFILRGSSLRYLLPLDILAIAISAIAAFLIRLGLQAYYDVAASAVIMLSLAILVKIPALYLLRLHESLWIQGPLRFGGRLAAAVVLSSLVLSALLLGAAAVGLLPAFSRAILLLDAALTFALLLGIRLVAYAFHQAPAGPSAPAVGRREHWRRWLAEGSIYYGIIAAGLSIYMLWNRVAFGTFTPVSGQIKHWWGTFSHSIYGTAATSWLTFFAVNPFSDFNAWAPPTTWLSTWSNKFLYSEATAFGNPRWQQSYLLILILAAAAAGLALLGNRKKSRRALLSAGMLPLFVGSWLQILAYNVTGYASPKEWYWLAQPIFLIVLGAAIANVALGLLPRQHAHVRALIWIFVAWYTGRAALSYWRDAVALNPYGQTPPGTPYMQVIPVLEQATRAGDVIGMTGGGNIGYLMPSRTVVNMDGLINSNEYFQALQAGTGADYLYDSGMRYVFANPGLLAANPYRGQYADRLQLVFHWGGKDLMLLLPNPAR